MTDHTQVLGKHPRRGNIPVDEELVELLELLWENGVETHFSCQGGPDEKYGEVEGYILLGWGRKEVPDFMAWLPGMESLKPHWRDKQHTRQVLLDRVGYYTEYNRYSDSLCIRFRNDMITVLHDLLSMR